MHSSKMRTRKGYLFLDIFVLFVLCLQIRDLSAQGKRNFMLCNMYSTCICQIEPFSSGNGEQSEQVRTIFEIRNGDT